MEDRKIIHPRKKGPASPDPAEIDWKALTYARIVPDSRLESR